LTIIGNLTKSPECRTTPAGKDVCSFTVAVNRRGKKDSQNNQPEADFFRVTAWDNLAKLCGQYLSKGRKVAVVGPVSLHMYTTQDGRSGASLEVTANDVEFLSPKGESQGEQVDPQTGYTRVDPDGLSY
jgi:single-strand DNA-binding protein